MISPIRYPGGKSKLKKHFIHLFPKAEEIDEFIDLFVGGGSITLYACEQGYKNIIANDINTNLINLHRGNVDYDLIQTIFNSSIEDKKIAFQEAKNKNDATNYFIVNKMSFSGLQKSTFSKGSAISNAVNSSYLRLKQMHEIFKKQCVKILNLDYKEIQATDNSFIFADPPYFKNSKQELYEGTHDTFNHLEFYNYITSKNCKWLITYDDCKEIREMYKDYKIIGFEQKYTMTNTNSKKCKMGKEIIIMNY